MAENKFYIGGKWVPAISKDTIEVINPADESVVAVIPNAGELDVDQAVMAARQAFPEWSRSSVATRLDYLDAINSGLRRRNDDLARAIRLEMGAPLGLARDVQAPSGTQHFTEILEVLRNHDFSTTTRRGTLVRQEPVGVCGLISPWNWPMNQVATKVAPAIAAGCTMVLKPSENAPLSAAILAEIIDEAGLPPGVFNLIQGRGADMGDFLTAHPDVDMVSFTGSTRAGVAISHAAAPTVKRVALELGGKSAGIVARGVDPNKLADDVVGAAMLNSGQSCNALTRLLLPADQYDRFAEAICTAVTSLSVGAPDSDVYMGPVASKAQWDKVQGYIEQGVAEGARLLVGGPGRPESLPGGWYVRPTVFGDVSADMRIAQDEIFGPVLVLMKYDTVDEAVALANGSPYGLSGFVWSDDKAEAVAIADRMRTGMVHINGAGLDSGAPFGGFKQSGNGREWGEYGLHEYLELKSIYGGA